MDLVTRAAGIAVPPNQGSSSSLLEAVAAPLAQEVPVMRGLDTARRADPSDSSGSDSPRGASDQALLSVGRLAGANGGGALKCGQCLAVEGCYSKGFESSFFRNETGKSVGVFVGVSGVLTGR